MMNLLKTTVNQVMDGLNSRSEAEQKQAAFLAAGGLFFVLFVLFAGLLMVVLDERPWEHS